MDLLTAITSLSYRDSVLSIIGTGLLVHWIFKRTETHEPIYLAILLLGIPTIMTGALISHSATFLTAVISTFSIFWTTLSTSIIVYRLSPWHPLAQYPGPMICKITKFWFAFLSLKGRQHIYYTELHAKYGDVVRVGPNELSFRTPAAVAPLMGPAGLAKGPFWDGRVPEQEKVKPMIALRDKKEHTRRRRPWTRGFSSAALKGYEPLITARCQQLVEVLSNQVGAVDMSKWMGYFAFGGGSEMVREGADVDGLWELLNAGQVNAIFMSHVAWLGALFLRWPGFFAGKDLKAFRAHAQKCAIARKKRGTQAHKDLFHHLIDEDGVATNPPSVFEVVSDGGLAIIAGSDTTSSALSNLFYYLLTNPKTYQRVRAEIDELGDDVMDYGKQIHLSYLTAAINEALRLLPPVLSGSQRATETRSEPHAVGPYVVPEGTAAFVPFYVLHRDPRCFAPFPDSFIPERWLPAEKQIELEPGLFKDQSKVVTDVNSFLSFSTGPSNCVGKNLAWMEMRMLACLLLQKFDMRFEDGYNPKRWEEEMLDYFVMLKGRLPIVLTPRK
ncbi:cytochrome P450 [Collybia nuda]|uniref:Cytochrome P450 n=1 Tax=Collybia nuda TaxID=64659 RepID=A0A9P5YI19_9AGAR|nr:cytochrome P450 [Collybia nuda]